jgi:UDP-3-O-[3-hydroxymyristoyl] glucosamine N-acyltransferase
VAVRSLAQLAAELGGTLEPGRGACPASTVVGVLGIDEAGPDHISFVSNRRYVRRLASTRAAAVLVDRSTPAHGATVIRVDDPYLAFAQALALFHHAPPVRSGVHPRAVVAPDATVDGAEIRALAYVGPGAVVGSGTVLHPGAHVGSGAAVGRDCVLMANAVVCDGCELGDRVVLNPGVVVGSEGFGFAPTADGHVKIPQVGRAVIESDVELGANSCVDRAAMGETRVGRGTKADNLVQVGHAAQVGEHALLVAYAAIAGSTRLGRFVTLAAKALVLGHLEIGDGVQVGAGSMVSGDLEPGARATGYPAFEHKSWRRAALAMRDLPDALRRLRALERRQSAPAEGDDA